jgi:hypothetical protein
MAQVSVSLNDINNFVKYLIIGNFYDDNKAKPRINEYLTEQGTKIIGEVIIKTTKNPFKDNPLIKTKGGKTSYLKLSMGQNSPPVSKIVQAFKKQNYNTLTGSSFFDSDKIRKFLEKNPKTMRRINEFTQMLTKDDVPGLNTSLSQFFKGSKALPITDKDVVTPEPQDEGKEKEPEPEEQADVQVEFVDAPVDAPVQPQLTQAPVTPQLTSQITEEARNRAIKAIMDTTIDNVLKKEILKTLDDLTKPQITPDAQVEFENAPQQAPQDAPQITPQAADAPQDARDLLPEAGSRAGVAQGATIRSRTGAQFRTAFEDDNEPEFSYYDPATRRNVNIPIVQDPELLQPEGTIARTANRIFQSIANGLTQQLPNLLINSGNNLDRLQMDVRNRVGRRAAALDFTSKIGLNILFNLVASLVATWYNTTYTPEEPVKEVQPLPTEAPPTEKPKEGSPEIKIADDLRQLLQTPIQTDIVKQEPLIVQVAPEPDIINVDPEKNKERYNKFVFNESKNKDNNPLVDLNELNENLRFFKNYINYNLETKKIFGEYTKPGELGKRISGTTTNIRGAPNYIAFNPRVENLGNDFSTDPHQSTKNMFFRDQGALDVQRYANFQF